MWQMSFDNKPFSYRRCVASRTMDGDVRALSVREFSVRLLDGVKGDKALTERLKSEFRRTWISML